MRGSKVGHVAPQSRRVPELMAELLASLAADDETPVFVKAWVAHYEIELIHPFSDGNGRIGRLWQHVVLLGESPVFSLVPTESVIKEPARPMPRSGSSPRARTSAAVRSRDTTTWRCTGAFRARWPAAISAPPRSRVCSHARGQGDRSVPVRAPADLRPSVAPRTLRQFASVASLSDTVFK
jgi:hypothetical protein